MRILWVKAGKILPLDSGGKIRSYKILERLAASDEVTFLSYYGGRRDEAYEYEIKRQLPQTVTFHAATPDTTRLERVCYYLWCLSSKAPFAVTKFTANRVRKLLAEWMVDHRFDVAVCDFLSASSNFPRHTGIPTVLFQHNVESVLWQRLAKWQSNCIKRTVYSIEAAKMLHYEREAVSRFTHVVAVSEEDRLQMLGAVGASRITVIPTGVDYAQCAAVKKEKVSGLLVVFTGSMDYEPNIDAVEHFCRDIWPRVRTQVPRAKFRIVGRNPAARVRRLACDSVELTGTVTSVVDHVREAAVVVVPLRVGGGTRIKIYEAMALGKAIVSTSIGAEGLNVCHGQNIVLADDPATFGEEVIEFLREPTRRRQFGAIAAAHVRQHDWSVVAKRFREVLERVVDSQALPHHHLRAHRKMVKA
jgi:glycosyltransferase involved in cell wall biosynthesis